jgi:hypothetical protein
MATEIEFLNFEAFAKWTEENPEEQPQEFEFHFRVSDEWASLTTSQIYGACLASCVDFISEQNFFDDYDEMIIDFKLEADRMHYSQSLRMSVPAYLCRISIHTIR